ncbi:MAG: hypothetical protein MHM6MM_006910 [Cercozoa sp. M6MM]
MDELSKERIEAAQNLQMLKLELGRLQHKERLTSTTLVQLQEYDDDVKCFSAAGRAFVIATLPAIRERLQEEQEVFGKERAITERRLQAAEERAAELFGVPKTVADESKDDE